MPAIHIRDVPETTLSALRERAARHGRSMQQEIREILRVAAAEPLPGEPVEPIRLVTTRTSQSTTWRREEVYGHDAR